MRIAIVSFEFPPETGYGGIASYALETSRMLSDAGHDVEVFCAGVETQESDAQYCYLVNKIPDLDKDSFGESLLSVFFQRHAEKPFDVVESAEIYADARCLKIELPHLPLVVKLHTPTFLCHRLNNVQFKLSEKFRFFGGALRRGRVKWLRPNLDVLHMRNERESGIYRAADWVTSPSKDLIRVIEQEWGVRKNGIEHLPNSYSPSKDILAIPPAKTGDQILYLGRLELRKGVADLVRALVIAKRRGLSVAVRFVGESFPSPIRGKLMDEWARAILDRAGVPYTFTGKIDRGAIGSELARSGLVVLPSKWENFPYTCIEAMAAGRVVIGSAQGGMADSITDGQNGFLIEPEDHSLLAKKIKAVLDCDEIERVARAARLTVINEYSYDAILPRQVQAYERAIEACQTKGNSKG